MEEDAIAAAVQALRAGRLSQGEEVAGLEKDLSVLFDGVEVVAVSSGTAALYLALAALGVQRGKKVIIPSYTCASVYAAVAYAGGLPVCADTGEDTVNITPSTVKAVLDDQVAAIIVPHMFGFEADIDGLLALGCPVIEDCAQALGGRYAAPRAARDKPCATRGKGALLGSKGHIAILSFYGTKLLPAGEGGACLTRDSALAEIIRLLRNCDEQPLNPRAFNFKMADLNAALARAQLPALDRMVRQRAALEQRYDQAFGQAAFRKKSAQSQAVCFRYLVQTEREIVLVLEQARAAGVICRRPVWQPLHVGLGGSCPRSARLHSTLVSVPLYPDLTAGEVETICRTIPGLLA